MNSKAFLTNYKAQLNWLRNQIKKENDDGIFLNKKNASLDFVSLKNKPEQEGRIRSFVENHLTEKGRKRLLNTIRVASNRANRAKEEGFLQVPLTAKSKDKLEVLLKLSGFTKVELINKLITNASLIKYQKK